MFPSMHIFHLVIPMYPLCIATGFLIGTFIAIKLGKKIAISERLVFLLMCWVEVGVLIGGKIMFLLVNFRNLEKVFKAFGFLGIFTKTGFVFYGGLIGGIVAVFFVSEIKKKSFEDNLSLVIVVAPLIHSFGRLGCFCSGCCYGKEWHGMISVFMHGAERFPVQLMESVANLILFAILIVVFLRSQNNREKVIPIYLIGYGGIRIVTESFRGDVSRGYIGFLSVSSWISIFCILAGLFFILKKHFKRECKK